MQQESQAEYQRYLNTQKKHRKNNPQVKTEGQNFRKRQSRFSELQPTMLVSNTRTVTVTLSDNLGNTQDMGDLGFIQDARKALEKQYHQRQKATDFFEALRRLRDSKAKEIAENMASYDRAVRLMHESNQALAGTMSSLRATLSNQPYLELGTLPYTSTQQLLPEKQTITDTAYDEIQKVAATLAQNIADYPKIVWSRLSVEREYQELHEAKVERQRKQTERALKALVAAGQLQSSGSRKHCTYSLPPQK